MKKNLPLSFDPTNPPEHIYTTPAYHRKHRPAPAANDARCARVLPTLERHDRHTPPLWQQGLWGTALAAGFLAAYFLLEMFS